MKPIYKRMLNLMKEKAKKASRKKKRPWFLYILRCSDNSFYTGITLDLDRRLRQHNEGTASRYTRTRRPVTLCYTEKCADRTAALVRECAVKSLPRSRKEALVDPGGAGRGKVNSSGGIDWTGEGGKEKK
jgi:putative endonuclease